MTEPRTVCYLGNYSRPWCTEVHVAASLERLGHRVVRLQESETDWSTIPARVETEQAHLFLWTRTWPAELAAVVPQLERLADMGVPTVSYHLDRWFGLDREHQVRDQPFFRTALVVSPDDSPRWADEGVEHLWMPPGVFGDECAPVAANRRRWPFDVVFVGSYPYPHGEWGGYRTELVGAFQRTFGRRFAVLPRKGQPIRGRLLQQLYGSVPVVVGDSCLAGESHRYWSDRIPETLGRGGFLIHPEIEGQVGRHGAWYDDTHLATYRLGDFDRAVKHAQDVLNDPDMGRTIGENARQLVTHRDTYRHRMDELLAYVERRFGWRDISEPAASPAPPIEHGRYPARCGRQWRGQFDPRPGDIDVVGGSFVVVDEVWLRNDYRIPPSGLSGTVVDVGANVGAFTVLAAKAGAAKVVAVEPYPTNRARLEHHVDLNGVADRVVIEPRAVVGDSEAGLLRIGGYGGGVHAGGRLKDEDEPWELVETISFADLIRKHAPIRFLKVDIEGGEYDAFEGLTTSILHENVEELALEFHGPVMPHLAHLADENQRDRWMELVAMLADCGRTEIFGHPTAGGLIWWKRY